MRVRSLLLLIAVIGAIGATSCGPDPTKVCARYVECQVAYDAAAGLEPTNVSAYRQDGGCWEREDSALVCEQRCGEMLADLRRAAVASDLALTECDP